MPVLRELLARELLMLAVVFALGSGPAALLGRRFGAVERVALAPVLGMCLGICVFTTLLYFFPAHDTDWLVPVLAAASLGTGIYRSHRAIRLRTILVDPLGWASLLVVLILVSAPILAVMRFQHTVGPVAYQVGDSLGYISEIDGDAHESLHTAVRAQPPFRDIADSYLTLYAQSYQNLDMTPLQANVDSIAGLGATSTWLADMIVFLTAGALGALAAVRWALRDGGAVPRSLSGVLAGVLFSGGFFLQLVFAGSQAATSGLSVLLPLAVIGADTVREPRWGRVALLALPVAGLMSMYPLFVAPMAAAGFAALLLLGLRRWRAGSGWRQAVAGGVARVALLVVVAAGLNLVSFIRDLRYWHALLGGAFSTNTGGFPVYNMKASTVPSWLLQTRNLFTTTPFGSAGFVVSLEEIALPVLLLAVALVALRKLPILLWLVAVIAVAVLLGEYEALKSSCSYCTDRSLLPVAPLLIALIALGIGFLWMTGRPLVRIGCVAIIVLWFLPAWSAGRDVRNRVSGTATFLSSSSRAALASLPHGASVDVEGYDASPAEASQAEPYAYELAEEISGRHATMPGDVDDYNALAYWGVRPLVGGGFNPNYQYVLTRLAGVHTGRPVVARYYGVALQRRVSALDVTIDGGITAPSEQLDPSGSVWVSNTAPLHLVVSGRSPGPAYVGVEMTASVPARLPPQPGVVSRRRGQRILVCARAAGSAPVRVADVSATYNVVPSSAAVGPYAQPPVGIGLQLDALRVSGTTCPFGGLRPPRRATSTATTAPAA